MKTSTTRIQKRSTCSVCGKDHAVDSVGRMVAHGYEVNWNRFVGNCSGVGEVHYGHKDSHLVIRRVIKGLESALASYKSQIESLDAEIKTLPHGKERRLLNNKVIHLTQTVERHIPSDIKMYQDRILNWTEFDVKDIDVLVEQQESKAKREAEKKVKQDAKAAKAKATEERKAKAEANKAKKVAELCEENYYRLYLGDDFLGEYVLTSKDEDGVYKNIADMKEEFLPKLTEEQRSRYSSDFDTQYWGMWGEVRNKAEGKGRCLLSTKVK